MENIHQNYENKLEYYKYFFKIFGLIFLFSSSIQQYSASHIISIAPQTNEAASQLLSSDGKIKSYLSHEKIKYLIGKFERTLKFQTIMEAIETMAVLVAMISFVGICNNGFYIFNIFNIPSSKIFKVNVVINIGLAIFLIIAFILFTFTNSEFIMKYINPLIL